jgi:hypothetical protein
VKSRILFCALAVAASISTHAAPVQLTNPTGWRMENYANNSIVIWSAGSPCAGGSIFLPGNFTAADANRLWATVTTAKTTGKKMFVYYDNANAPTSCPILSFGLDPD